MSPFHKSSGPDLAPVGADHALGNTPRDPRAVRRHWQPETSAGSSRSHHGFGTGARLCLIPSAAAILDLHGGDTSFPLPLPGEFTHPRRYPSTEPACLPA